MCIHPPVLFIDSHRSSSYKPQARSCAAFAPILLQVPIRKKSPSAAHMHTCTRRQMQGFAVKRCLAFLEDEVAKANQQKVPQQRLPWRGRRKERWWGKAVGGGNSPLRLLFQKRVFTRHTSSKGSSHSP